MNILYSEHPVMFKNNPIKFIFTLILIPVFGLGIIIFLIWHIKNKSSKLIVTNTLILYEKGLLSKERCEVKIGSVRTIKVKQSFIHRIFGTGNIEIYTAGDKPEFIALGMPEPNKIRDFINIDREE